MVLGVVRAIWGEHPGVLETPVIATYPMEATDYGAMYDILRQWAEMDIADASLETCDGALLGCLLPNGKFFVFCPN